jgi:uncharacterized iron-regulated membrane protein
MRKALLKIHQYLGLITGIVVFIVSITGCLWVFKEEIESLYEKDTDVQIRNAPLITPTKAKEIALTVFPDKAVHGTHYGKPGEAVEVIFYQAEPEFYRSVYLHPYSGEIMNIKDREAGFFAFVLDGHMHLWLPEKIGGNVVAVSVLTFMVILLTGIVLWWPKKRNRRQRFKFDWKDNTKWRRKNFDLHAVIGFYVMILAFVLAFTGSVMALDWFYKFAYKSLGGEKTADFIIPDNVSPAPASLEAGPLPIDKIVGKLRKENPNAAGIEVHYPYNETASMYIEVSHQEGVYYSSDYRFFDRYTLEEINTPSIYGKYEDAGFADKVLRMNYDIHVGAIGGFPGKMIAFIIGLLTASLPVTGFLLWYGRNYKTKKRLENSFIKPESISI